MQPSLHEQGVHDPTTRCRCRVSPTLPRARKQTNQRPTQPVLGDQRLPRLARVAAVCARVAQHGSWAAVGSWVQAADPRRL